MLNKKLCFIFGTRPEVIKLSPIIKLCQKEKIPFFCIHTGQHYSVLMNAIFIKELGLPIPKYKLGIKSKGAHLQGDHTGRMLIGIEKILLKEMPYCVVVQGDTNTTLAGALAARKLTTTGKFTSFDIKIAHVEAGLRSYDMSMPEECNRIIVDRLSDILFAPTQLEKNILSREGLPRSIIHVTGNTIVDVLKEYAAIAKRKSVILKTLGLRKGAYILLTLHRQENVDVGNIFLNIVRGLSKTEQKLEMPIIFPVHQRTVKKMQILKIKMPKSINVIAPVSFTDFLSLEANAALTMTDSGGVQEESCVLKVPCVTLRDSTERPQTVSVGANIVAGTNPNDIMRAAIKMYKGKKRWANPLGNGKAAERILSILFDKH